VQFVDGQFESGEELRHAAKTDDNQAEIVKALRSVGVSVEYIKLPVDLIICHRGQTSLMEIKTPEGRLTKDQVEFIARWPGKIHIVKSPQEAINAVIGEQK